VSIPHDLHRSSLLKLTIHHTLTILTIHSLYRSSLLKLPSCAQRTSKRPDRRSYIQDDGDGGGELGLNHLNPITAVDRESVPEWDEDEGGDGATV
jgi:hypothetical protein